MIHVDLANDAGPISKIKTDLLKAIFADRNPTFDVNRIDAVVNNLKLATVRFSEDFMKLK